MSEKCEETMETIIPDKCVYEGAEKCGCEKIFAKIPNTECNGNKNTAVIII